MNIIVWIKVHCALGLALCCVSIYISVQIIKSNRAAK